MADAVTLSPFMGFDSVSPYLQYQDKGAFLLCRTSNPGGDDLQSQRLGSVAGEPLLYEHVARPAQGPWNLNGQLGLVVGATYPEEIERVRAGAHGAAADPRRRRTGRDVVATVRAGWRPDAPIVVNSSRAICYASSAMTSSSSSFPCRCGTGAKRCVPATCSRQPQPRHSLRARPAFPSPRDETDRKATN